MFFLGVLTFAPLFWPLVTVKKGSILQYAPQSWCYPINSKESSWPWWKLKRNHAFRRDRSWLFKTSSKDTMKEPLQIGHSTYEKVFLTCNCHAVMILLSHRNSLDCCKLQPAPPSWRWACTMPTQWSWTPLSVLWSSARSCASNAARWCPSARISPFGRILGRSGTIWDHLGRSGTIWDLDPLETLQRGLFVARSLHFRILTF